MKSLYREEDAELLTAGPFAVVQMDRFTIQDYAAKTGRPVEEVKEAFERLAKRGVLFSSRSKFYLYKSAFLICL